MAIVFRESSALEKASALCKFSFTFLRNWSIATPDGNAAVESAGSASKKPKRRKKKNFFEVAQFLPNWGVGYHMAKTHWTSVSYEITKINLYKDGRHGKAWGIAHKDAQAVGVGESAYDFRSRNTSTSKGASSSTSTKRKQSSARTSLVDEEEINIDDETEEEEEDTNGHKCRFGR